MSSSIPSGSYVWYFKKNALVKILDFDLQSNSYTIEYKGRVIDTIERYLDPDIGLHVKKILDKKEKRIADLETYIKQLKEYYEKLLEDK